MTNDNGYLLQVRDLHTYFYLHQGVVKAVEGVNLRIRPGSTLGVVGESGCGKSVTARSVLRIVEQPGRIVSGEIVFRRKMKGGQTEDLNLGAFRDQSREMREIRGKEISMIFQEPMASLSPHYTIGSQISENLLLHQDISKADARDRTIELLRDVGIARPEARVDAYPYQLSGGMCQRAVIAMAIACRPSLLIADEPTTALDVTTQAQILDLLREMQEQIGMAIMLITHDLGVVAEMADDVAVMYLGRVAEHADVDTIFHDARHPYTQALLRSIPTVGSEARERLATIRGMVPDPFNRPSGCVFHPRCDAAQAGLCDVETPVTVEVAPNHEVTCCACRG
ncbi:MAG: ABC transporter ATP-binding protein [Chloroflexi bacterium]|nr:ABC transporter ATP-binding protein [Chloroflexota bacterium]